MTTRTFWLSFCDPERPEGDQFVGVCIIDVNDIEAEAAELFLRDRFPNRLPVARWIVAATQKARAYGCNPGGEVQSTEITAMEPAYLMRLPRQRLLSKEDLAGIKGTVQPATVTEGKKE